LQPFSWTVLFGVFSGDFLGVLLGGFPGAFFGQLVLMTSWSRLASAMVFLVVATIGALGLFGDGSAGFGRSTLLVGVIAVAAALVLAAVIAKAPSGEPPRSHRPFRQMRGCC